MSDSNIGTGTAGDEFTEPRDKARMVLKLLRAANLNPGYAFDQGDAEELWGAKLADYDLADLLEAADEWLSTPGNDFPTLAEFETAVAGVARRAPALPRGNAPCPECGNTPAMPSSGYVVVTPGEFGTPETVRPCSRCRPEEHDLWSRGHFMPRSGKCRCGSEHCGRRSRRRAKAEA